MSARARNEIRRIGNVRSVTPEDVVRTELGDYTGVMDGHPFCLQVAERDMSPSGEAPWQ